MELNVNQVADILQVKPHRVRELIKAGKLKARHHPTAYRWMVDATSVRNYVRSPMQGVGRRRKVDGKWLPISARQKQASC